MFCSGLIIGRTLTSLLTVGFVLEVQSQSYLPWKFGWCQVPPIVQNFNASSFFIDKWYLQSSYGNFLTQGVGICPTLDSEILPSGVIRQISYQYEQLTMTWTKIEGTSSLSEIQNGQGYLKMTYGLVGGLIPFDVPLYMVGTDYDDYAVVFSCRQQLFLKLEMSWVLTRARNGTNQTATINSTIQNAGLDINQYVTSTNVGCGPNEPFL